MIESSLLGKSMHLNLPTPPGKYTSNSQIIRVVTEEWGKYNLYCPACECNNLNPTPNNTRAIDYICQSCSQQFQLKSCGKWNENRVVDAGYQAMIAAIRSDTAPNLFVLHYADWQVKNLLLVPHFFFTETAIEKRQPLAETARRAGWVGGV